MSGWNEFCCAAGLTWLIVRGLWLITLVVETALKTVLRKAGLL